MDPDNSSTECIVQDEDELDSGSSYESTLDSGQLALLHPYWRRGEKTSEKQAATMYGVSEENPSQIMRRIRVAEAENDELPTLPSPPGSDVNDSSYQTSMVVRKPSKAMNNNDQQNSMNRRILSPLRINNNNSMIPSERLSPKDASMMKKRKIQPASIRILSPALTAPSTASSGRTVMYAPSAAVRQPGKTARSKEISFSDTSEYQQGDSTSINLDIPPSSPEQDVSQLLDPSTSQNSLNLDSQDLEQLNGLESELHQLSDISASRAHQDEADSSSTPIPSTANRTERISPKSPIAEEDEKDDDSNHSVVASPVPSTSADEALSAIEQRIAHVVVRRRTNPVIRRSAALRNKLPASPDSRSSSTKPSPSYVNKTGDQFGTPSDYSTPGMGRRMPSAEKQEDQGISARASSDTYTPARHQTEDLDFASPSTGITSRAYPDSYATPRITSCDADLERRKTHLLSTLRLTALRSGSKLKSKRGTPFPNRNRRSRSATPANELESYGQGDSTKDLSAVNSEQDDMTTTSSASTSSHDLTTHPRGTGNTSLPVVGTGIDAMAANRFNGTKLNNYLHTLNTHLTKENQSLVDTLAETQNELQRLVHRTSVQSSGNTLDKEASTSIGKSDEDGDTTREMVQEHQRTRDDIAKIRHHLTGNAGMIGVSSKEASMAKELIELREQLEDRDREVSSLRDQILQQNAGDDTNSVHVSGLQCQIFSLTDELSSARSEASSHLLELNRLRQEVVQSASRNTAALSDLQARTDELLVQLEDRDEEIGNAQDALEDQEAGFANKMKNLEEELCKVMEEQEEQLRATRKELQGVQTIRQTEEKQRMEWERRTLEAEQNLKTNQTEKQRLEIMLNEAAPKTLSPGGDTQGVMQREVIQHLQESTLRLEEVLKTKEEEIRQMMKEAAITSSKYSDTLGDLKDRLEAAERNKVQVERKTSSQAVLLKETENTLEESEANFRNANNQISRLQSQLEEAKVSNTRLRQEQANLSVALDSDLQKKLDAAQREIGNLRHQLASPSANGTNADAKELEIRTLRSDNHELETRVGQLKRQAITQAMLTPNKSTADKSVRFESVNSMRTPRSASQLLGNVGPSANTLNTLGKI